MFKKLLEQMKVTIISVDESYLIGQSVNDKMKELRREQIIKEHKSLIVLSKIILR